MVLGLYPVYILVVAITFILIILYLVVQAGWARAKLNKYSK